jgi:Zn-dependent protease with chaperone function
MKRKKATQLHCLLVLEQSCFKNYVYLQMLSQIIVKWVWTYPSTNCCLVYVMYFLGIGYNFLSLWWSNWIEKANINLHYALSTHLKITWLLRLVTKILPNPIFYRLSWPNMLNVVLHQIFILGHYLDINSSKFYKW